MIGQRRAVFLDRDGVINVNRPDHVKSWDEFVFLPGVLDALRELARADLFSIVTTNQSAINRKLADDAEVRRIHAKMRQAIEGAGGCIHGIYYCPHRPDENCDCRKPKPGMYLHAARDLDLDLAHSFVVGDASADVQAAQAIGAQPILVLTGRGCEHRNRGNGAGCPECDLDCIVVPDLRQAVEWILQKERVPRECGG